MKDWRLYSFDEAEFRLLGRMMADRDAFIVFFYLAGAGSPMNIGQLASRFRRDPATINEIVEQLASLGLARRKYGQYVATDFGLKAKDFLMEIVRGVQPSAVEAEAPSARTLILQDGLSSSATNNSVYSTIAITGYAGSEKRDLVEIKPGELTTESEAKNFENRSELPTNAARPHNYL